MQLGFRRNKSEVGVVIISGSCCIPGMAPLDEKAKNVVEQAISESGVTARLRVIPASTAVFGGVPRKLIAELMGMFNQSGRIGLPAVLVNGEVVSYGIPDAEQVRRALIQAAEA